MPVAAKICGLNSPAAIAAAVEGGARHIGFVFYPPSPRAVTPEQAAALREPVPHGVATVGLLVDASDAAIEAILRTVRLDLLQLSGSESPDRVRAVRDRFGVPVMKAIAVATGPDLDRAADYLGAADWLLFDAKPPAQMPDALPGGNALSFDWRLMAGRSWPLPWMLAGGLNAANLPQAVQATGAAVVDVSSGVEDAPGRKNPVKIRQFLAAAAAL